MTRTKQELERCLHISFIREVAIHPECHGQFTPQFGAHVHRVDNLISRLADVLTLKDQHGVATFMHGGEAHGAEKLVCEPAFGCHCTPCYAR